MFSLKKPMHSFVFKIDNGVKNFFRLRFSHVKNIQADILLQIHRIIQKLTPHQTGPPHQLETLAVFVLEEFAHPSRQELRIRFLLGEKKKTQGQMEANII